MKVLKNFLMIKPEERKQKNGLVVAEEQEELERAKVVAVGPEVENVKKGDIVLYKNFNLNSVQIENEKHIFVSADDVLAIQ